MFNADAFEQAQFEPREESVSVPALADFFDGEDTNWTVRGLSANELNRALEADRTHKDLGAIADAIGQSANQVEAIRQAIGLAEKATPGEISKRIVMLTAGSVSPSIEMVIAAKLAENFPIEFMQLTNTISTLTGMGSSLVKPKAASQKNQS